jgi:hypothetical protein
LDELDVGRFVVDDHQLRLLDGNRGPRGGIRWRDASDGGQRKVGREVKRVSHGRDLR